MNTWYKTAQQLSYRQDLTQALLPGGFSGQTILKKVMRTLKSFGMEQVFENLAKQNNYEGAVDFVLCHFMPEFNSPCQEYYRGDGVQLKETLSSDELIQLDNNLATILAETLRNS